MSWEAVTWASKQRMKLPHEQLILLVLANCADPDGVAFTQWRGREHWWKYLVEHTRLSKSSLFRHINTLVNLEICSRSMVVLADGSRRPVVTLDLAASFDIDAERDQEKYEVLHSHPRDQSHGETEGDDATNVPENVSDDSALEHEITAPSLQSHGETGPVGGNENSHAIPMGGNRSFPIVGMQEDSKSVSKESPPTPRAGGASAFDEGWEEFSKTWREPMQRMAIARHAWDGVPTAKRGEAITAARGYFAWLTAQRKPPTVVSAQTFLRDVAGWAQWLRYAPEGGTQPLATAVFPRGSREALAIGVLYEIAGKTDFLRSVMTRNNAVNYSLPITPRLTALAEAPPRAEWVGLDRQQAAAWENLLSEAVTVQVRTRLRERSLAPWPWPPRKDGTLSQAGPPGELSEAECADFK